MSEFLLKLEGISKNFVNVKALENVDLTLKKGEIISLAGSNGAGKSTLLKILYSIHRPNKGTVKINNKKIDISNISLNKKLPQNFKIALVPQEPKLVPDLSVLENVFLGAEIAGNFKLNNKKMTDICNEYLDILDYELNIGTKVKYLSRDQQGIVSIIKALIKKPNILCLDEVTACLCREEVSSLFEVVKRLKKQGISIIFISHKIKEMAELSDRVVVLKDGKNAGELVEDEIKADKIVDLMLGGRGYERQLLSDDDRSLQKVCLQVKNLQGRDQNKCRIKDISFKIYQGEIVGLAGLKGSGIDDVFEIIFGLQKKGKGTIELNNNKEYSPKNPAKAMKNNIGFIPKDRHKEGLALVRNITENISINELDHISNFIKMINYRVIENISKKYSEELNIVTPSVEQEVRKLSGGNQQKVLLAKWLYTDPDVLLINEPTRGVDIKVKNEIYNLLRKLKNQNKGILVHSPEVRELIKMCDRILILSSGEIIENIEHNDIKFNENYILQKINS